MLRLILLLVLTLSLGGCASNSEAISQALKMAISRGDDTTGKALNPSFAYLRVSTEGRTVFLALGFVEVHPDGNVEVWYSAKGEVVRLQNGRIVGTTGLLTDWRDVRYTGLPPWTAVGDTPITIRRSHDEMPGYRFDIEESLALRTIPPPTDSLLANLAPASLRWFEERSVTDASAPPARYAVNIEDGYTEDIYGEQCLTANFCLAWQRWPVSSGAAN